ncbi:MAG: TPM domain-containing protein, partial [Bacteroidetes bacterium]|nr:TPM domain-containing protein [Bacteroidota bacterium]
MKFSLFKKKPFFTDEEQQEIVAAIASAEKQTSGEIRVYIENRCRFLDPIDRAAEAFYALKMENTEAHNAVLVYVAIKDRQLALYGDKGIHEKVGSKFWNEEVKLILSHFNKENYKEGLISIITGIG